MDRNLFYSGIYKDRINKIIKAENFFSDGYIIKYKRTNGLIGEWKFLNFDDNYSLREFDLDFGRFWYPLVNNKVPKFDDDWFSVPEKFAGKHYNEFPLNTRIGWRGPCMLLEDLKKLPKILLTKEEYYH